MKNYIVVLTLVAISFGTGCARQRYPAVAVATTPSEVVVVPAPVSDRPSVRVYPETTQVVTLPAGVSATEHAIAENIRATFNIDPAWKSLTDNVEIRVSGSKVTLRGVVVNDAVRDRIEQKIKNISGVTSIDNGLTVLPK